VCGIAGIRTGVRQQGDLERVVRRLTSALAHRGPDGEGIWLDASSGIAM
jgi:asparagine synthase (glutamine-hydrolysing)